MLTFEHQLRVDLIRHDREPVMLDELREHLQRRRIEHGAGRVVRAVEHQDFRLVRDFPRDLGGVDGPRPARVDCVTDRPAERKAHEGLVDREPWVGDQHLVAGLDQRGQRIEEHRLGAGRDEHVLGAGGKSMPAHPLRDRFAQRGESGGRGVFGGPGPEGPTAGLDDVGRRRKVGLADLQVQDGAALSLEPLRPGEHLEGGLGTELLDLSGQPHPCLEYSRPRGPRRTTKPPRARHARGGRFLAVV